MSSLKFQASLPVKKTTMVVVRGVSDDGSATMDFQLANAAGGAVGGSGA